MDSLVGVLGLSSSAACGLLVPQPRIKPISPALQGRFLTTGPPGKSWIMHFKWMNCVACELYLNKATKKKKKQGMCQAIC